MRFIFIKKGKAKEVFKSLLEAALLEAKFGQIWTLDETDTELINSWRN